MFLYVLYNIIYDVQRDIYRYKCLGQRSITFSLFGASIFLFIQFINQRCTWRTQQDVVKYLLMSYCI